METATEGTRGALADACSDLLALALQLRKASDPGTEETLRPKVAQQFQALETRARQADVPQEDIQQAKYAIAAFIDEMILTSNWPVKETWSGKPLQLEYFNDFAAGEEFYNKLEALRAAGAKRAGVLEVYYLCLALGFRGKYVDLQGMEKRKVLVDQIARELRAARTPEEQTLSPRWQPPDELPRLVSDFPVWMIAAAGGFVIVVIFALFKVILGAMTGGAVEPTP